MKNRRKRSVLVYALIFLLFLGIMDYPFIARLVNERNVDGVVTGYKREAKNIDMKAKEQKYQDALAYNQMLANGNSGIKDTFYAKDADTAYLHLLDVYDDGVMGIIKIPKIDVELPIYHGTEEEVLQKGAGHVEGSSLPIGGKSTHSCLSAHRGMPNKKMFTNLDEMENGDLFFIETGGEPLAYRVDQILVEEPDNIEPLKIEEGKDRVTLITCTPYGINSHRMYVRGTRTEYNSEVKGEADAYKRPWIKDYWWILLNILLILMMGYTLYQYGKTPKEKERRNVHEEKKRTQ